MAGWHCICYDRAWPAGLAGQRARTCSGLGGGGTGAAGLRCAAAAAAAVRRSGSGSRALPCRAARRQPDDEQNEEEAVRDQRKRLTRLFYSSAAPQPPPPPQQQPPAAPGTLIPQLPLWRVEWPALPGGQQVLHVLLPTYVHLFEGLFSAGRRQDAAGGGGSPGGWLFGHLYLPGGSRSLGSELHSLASGSAAPLVGVVMRVSRAVRLRDGKMLVLATGLGRFKVVRCCQELPYSVADVELLEDEELLAEYEQPALNAVMQAAGDEAAVAQLMVAARAAAREGAAAAASAWLAGYELRLALQQEWGGPGPREGGSDAETYGLVTELTQHGVAEVLPLPDGLVIGRCDLEDVAAGAEAVAQQALAGAAHRLLAQQQQQQQQQQVGGDAPGPSCADESGTDGGITSLNTTAERGIAFEAPEFAALTSSSGSSSIGDVLALEAAVWAHLDTLCALASRVRGRRLQALPYGLLQLRPPPLRPAAAAGMAAAAAAAAAADGQQHAGGSELQQQQQQQHGEGAQDGGAAFGKQQAGSGSSSSSASEASPAPHLSSRSLAPGDGALPSPSRYAFAASDGMDVTAHPRYPPLRRAARLSWAVWGALAAGALERDAEGQQALLECSSVAGRLRFLAGLLSKQAKVLAALAAVKDVQA